MCIRDSSKVEPDHEPDAPRAQRARVSASGLDDDDDDDDALIFMRRRNKVEPDHEPDAHRAQRARVSASGLDDDERLRASGNRGAQRAWVSASGLDDDERLRENRIRGPGEIPQDVSVVSMLKRGETDGRNMQLETCVEEYLDQ